MSNSPVQAVRGMNDILPDEAGLWLWFEDEVRDWLEGYGYRNIRMPLLEQTALFKRAIGEVTDIVEKEMYSFEDSQRRPAHAAPGRDGFLRARGVAAQSAV